MKSLKWILAKKFVGTVSSNNFKLVEEDMAVTLGPGEVLCQAVMISVDPYIRPKGERDLSIGDVIMAEQVAKVIASENSSYPVGKFVLANVGWRTHTVVPSRDLSLLRSLPPLGDLDTSLALGVLGLTGMSAYFGVVKILNPQPGDVMVVSTAAGGVGSIVGQLGKIMGCRVIGICGSKEKCSVVTSELGMDVCINYKEENVNQRLQEIIPQGADHFFDNVGGDLSTTIMYHMKTGGRVAVCGAISMYDTQVDTPPIGLQPHRAILSRQLMVQGFNVLQWYSEWPDAYIKLLEWIDQGKIRPKETVYQGFHLLTDAFIDMFAGANIGKTVVKTS